jgi:histidinol dehydrogenase
MRILDLKAEPGALSEILRPRMALDPEVDSLVSGILGAVRAEGDAALIRFARQFDSVDLAERGLRVGRDEIRAAVSAVSGEFRKALDVARKNIARYHRRQIQKSWTFRAEGMRLEQRYLPLNRVGIYVPGGKAAYPSTVLMNAIPALIAGVPEVVMVTPCSSGGSIRPEVLVAADECGVREIYRVGGAQAIAALAFGTESIRAVDKITGPGNAYVASAKKQVFGVVGIDMIAGPTEVVIVAEGKASPVSIASDMIAQAEHDERASSILLTTDRSLIAEVERELRRQLESAPRGTIARRALEDHGALVLVRSLAEAAAIVNRIAPEHLEVLVLRPREFVAKIRNAGAIFVGEWSTEALGDYILGPNHTLPTQSTARFSSALGVHDFMKFSNIIEVNERRFRSVAHSVEVLARAEGLAGHEASVRMRRES